MSFDMVEKTDFEKVLDKIREEIADALEDAARDNWNSRKPGLKAAQEIIYRNLHG